MNIQFQKHPILVALMAFALTAHAQTDVRMMTYNIMGHGMTDTRLENLGKVITLNKPDVVALQEVDNRNIFNRRVDQLAKLATATGMLSKFHALVGNYYGIGILSKTKPLSVENRTWQRNDESTDKENRGCIIAEFADYYFVCTHYSLNDVDRDAATADLIKFARSVDKPVFVAGDFNAKPNYRAMMTFKNNGFKILNDVTQYTFPSDKPESCIDMIIFYDSTKLFEYAVEDSGVAGVSSVNINNKTVTSDHLPVFLDLSYSVTSGINAPTEQQNLITMETGSIINRGEQNAEVEVFTLTGKKAAAFMLAPCEKRSLNTFLPRGLYVVRAVSGTKTTNGKIMVD